MIGLIVLGLAFLFFLVVAYFAAQTWHVGHVVSLSFLFLFTLLALFMTATLLRTNKEYHPKYAKAAEDLVREKARTHTLMYGDGSSLMAPGSVTGERALAKVEQISRGRVWRNVYRAPGGQGNIIGLNMTNWNNDGCLRVGQEDEMSDDEIEPIADEEVDGEGEEAVDAVPASSHGLVENQFVYAFKDFPISRMTAEQKAYYFNALGGEGEESFANQDEKGMCRVPIAYLGKFLVVKTDANFVQLQLQGIPDQGQIAQLQNKGPWVLYERLPTDVANLFDEANAETLAKILPLKRFVDFGLPMPQSAYQSMIREYALDGEPFTARVNDPFRLLVEVKFLKEYSQVVDLQVEGDLPPADQPFNVEGHAQVKSMIQGEPTSFASGDTAMFDGETAAMLVRQGIAEQVGDPTYRRQLRAFEYNVADYQDKFDEMSSRIRETQARVNELNGSLKNLQTQIDKHREELDELRADQQGFDAEKAELEKYRRELRQRYQKLESEVDALTAT